MSNYPGRITRFWKELKRRKVIKAVTMYGATAFILMEAADIMLPRLGLPEWSVTFLIVLLIIGLPIAIVLSWIFDLTPEGVQKTGSQSETVEEDKPESKKASLFSASNLIIVALLIIVCILLYPRIFHKDKLADVRDEQGKISIAVMPFENLTGDTLYNTWQGGVQNLVISTLSNSGELQVRQYRTVSELLSQKTVNRNASGQRASLSPTLTRELTRNLEVSTYIQGRILKAGDMIRINAQLVNAENEEVYKTFQIETLAQAGLFSSTDSLAEQICNYLEIQELADRYNSPEIEPSVNTQSAVAFDYYIRSYETFESNDIAGTIQWLNKAIETDPGFTEAYVVLTFCLATLLEFSEAERILDFVYQQREQAPLRSRLLLDHLHAYFYETPHEEIRYCKQILEVDEFQSSYWLLLGDAYAKLNRYQDAVTCYEKALEIHEKWGTHMKIPHLYYWMGDALHELGRHKRENEIYLMGLELAPESWILRSYQISCALSRGADDEAAEYMDKYRAIFLARGATESRIMGGLGVAYYEAERYAEAEKLLRQALSLDPENPYRMHWLARVLIEQGIKLEEALHLAEKAVSLKPEYFSTLHTLGFGLYKQERYQEAKEILDKAWSVRGVYDPALMKLIKDTEEALALQNS